jgi:hypothetical protein
MAKNILLVMSSNVLIIDKFTTLAVEVLDVTESRDRLMECEPTETGTRRLLISANFSEKRLSL